MGNPIHSMQASTESPCPTPSGSATDAPRTARMALNELIDKKQQVEEELSALGNVLDSHGVTMDTSLLTSDGFPRDDIDVAQIRLTRARIICLRNDYKAILSQIETALYENWADLVAVAPSQVLSAPTVRAKMADEDTSGIESPFARVTSVVPGSPADEAGLEMEDRIKRFGDATWINHEKLNKIAETVHRNQGRPITVRVLRPHIRPQQDEELELQVTPRSGWGGRGLLGCHLLPL